LAESGAVNILPYTTDYDADIRQGNLGSVSTGTAPDIGADEFDATVDVTAANILFTAISSGCSLGDRSLSAVITDASGVPTSGTLVPRIYYKKGSLGTWYSQAGVFSPARLIMAHGILRSLPVIWEDLQEAMWYIIT